MASKAGVAGYVLLSAVGLSRSQRSIPRAGRPTRFSAGRASALTPAHGAEVRSPGRTLREPARLHQAVPLVLHLTEHSLLVTDGSIVTAFCNENQSPPALIVSSVPRWGRTTRCLHPSPLAAAIAPKRVADPIGLRMDELPEDPPGALRPTASAMLPTIVRTSFLGVLPVPLHVGRASVKFRHVKRLHRLGYDGRCGSETSTTHTEIKRPSRSSSDCSIFILTSSAVSGVQPAHFVGRHFSVAPNQNTR